MVRVKEYEQGWVEIAFRQALMSRTLGSTRIKTLHQIEDLAQIVRTTGHKLRVYGIRSLREQKRLTACLAVKQISVDTYMQDYPMKSCRITIT